MAVRLYDYQEKALDKLFNGSILCGGVGSGKSLTAIAYYFKRQGGEWFPDGSFSSPSQMKDLYIITTARKRDTLEWEKELARFDISKEKELNHGGESVYIDSWNNIGKYVGVKGAFFIFDEQRVVGYGAWVKSFLKITKPEAENEWILLSATPGDTWMDYLPVFIANGYFRSKSEFVREHVIYSPFTKYPKIDRYVRESVLAEYRNDILVNMDYERKTRPHHIVVPVEYDATMYRLIFRHKQNPETGEPFSSVSELCYALRRCCNEDPSRIFAVKKIVEEKSKVIIFYNFDYELETLRNIDYGDGYLVREWNGHKHEQIPLSDKWVYLVQYTAGAEGWNCTTTDTIIFYSQNYSYKVMIQSAGRIDRLNSPYKDLYYYHLRSNSTIDISIGRALKMKKKFNENAFFGSKMCDTFSAKTVTKPSQNRHT